MIHMCHHKHPLVLQFNSERLSCKICKITRRRGYVYGCSPCKFVVHIECVLSPSPALIIDDKSHPHPLTLFPRRASFICDACGTEGFYSVYICSLCNIIVHKYCTSLPPIIKSKWHDHRISHKYFLPHDVTNTDCIICHHEVNSEHGGYCCSICNNNITFHVNCVTAKKDSYSIVSHEDEGEIWNESSITFLETNDAGEATKVKHFKHIHSLMLSPLVGGYENSCDGCMLPISDRFYSCSQCDFSLHKACAELPKVKHVWHHDCQQPLILISDKVFMCETCFHVSNSFAYECCECEEKICIQCVIALTPGAQTSSKHEHPLFFYRENDKKCNACGITAWEGLFRCKEDCNFVLDRKCFSLPSIARHKCDEHFLKLNDHDDSTYSESHYCDICEGNREPSLWFYHCATCNTSAHKRCVLGKHPFVKLGSSYEGTDHAHPLTFVKKIYYYPDCEKCGKSCEDLALECPKSGCNYIVHWECVARAGWLRW